jgi:selenocysteine-specific elongation factor
VGCQDDESYGIARPRRNSLTDEVRLESSTSKSSTIRAVIGTAGHVDHGKTTLVQQLTGMETDRLQEEKLRGISIELGFAWLDLDPHSRVALIDVPGHERFVRQMIAGAAGIDLVLLIIAADEGVMPQTREHLDICELLGVQAGAIVLTKTDLVEPDWLELVIEDVTESVQGTFLDGAPFMTYSAMQPETIQNVRSGISALLDDVERAGKLANRSQDRPFKLSIDRAFTMKGFGTIVTGTSSAGALKVGDPVAILPDGPTGRVRGLQVHGEATDQVAAGVRVAVNIQGVEHSDIRRGQVLARPDSVEVVSMFDGTFRPLARLEAPIPDRTRVLVHVGTAQVEGTLAWVGDDVATPGEPTGVQVRLDTPLPMLPGEPFVARGFTVLAGYGKTLGGGRALTPALRRHRQRDRGRRPLIETLREGDSEASLLALVRYESTVGVPLRTLPSRLPFERALLDEVAGRLESSGALVIADGVLYPTEVVSELADRALVCVTEHHERNPAWPGVVPAELRTRVRADLSQELFAHVIECAIGRGALARRGAVLACPDFSPSLSAAQRRASEAVLTALEAGECTPVRLQDLPDEVDLSPGLVDEALELLVASGDVIRVSKEFFYTKTQIDALQGRLISFLEGHDVMDTAAFKELTGASRKWTIPLGEYFDRIHLTIRVGNDRRLRR